MIRPFLFVHDNCITCARRPRRAKRSVKPFPIGMSRFDSCRVHHIRELRERGGLQNRLLEVRLLPRVPYPPVYNRWVAPTGRDLDDTWVPDFPQAPRSAISNREQTTVASGEALAVWGEAHPNTHRLYTGGHTDTLGAPPRSMPMTSDVTISSNRLR